MTDQVEPEENNEAQGPRAVKVGNIFDPATHQFILTRGAQANFEENKALSSLQTSPHSLDAECGVLCGLLIDLEAFDNVSMEGLKSDDFYHPAHATIFLAMEQLQAESEPINTVTLTDKLVAMKKLKGIGGVGKLAQLEIMFPTSAHVGAYCRIIIEKSILRRLISTATSIVELAHSQEKKADEVIDNAEQSILAIRDKTAQKGMAPIKDLVKQAMERFFEMQNNKDASMGVPSGFIDLDRLTNGFQPGELIIIAARPSMGKTAFTLNVAAHAAMQEQMPVGFFSLEMGCEQLIQRLVGSEARINLSNLRRGLVKGNESSKLTAAYGRLADAAMYIDESPTLNIGTLRNKCRRLVHNHDVKIIIIDYLQLMSSVTQYDNKATEVGEISRGLKAIAREFNVPVIALSQLNRGVESRIDKRPMMSDLRESGAIEQDADIIVFLYREEYYLREKTPEDKLGLAEVIIAKNRNGPTGSLELKFFNSITRFMDLDRNHSDYEFET